MEKMEKTVLDKTLSTGQHLVLTYTVTSPRGRNGFTAIVDGVIVCEGFSTTVERDATGLPDTPHLFQVPNIPGAPAPPDRFGAPVGLTTQEADHLEAVVAQIQTAATSPSSTFADSGPRTALPST